MYPFFPGYSRKTYEPYPEPENSQKYAESQKQRYYERQVRQSRNECAMLDAMGDREGFEKAAVRLKQKESTLKQYCDSTGRSYKADRVQTNGFNRSVSGKAVAANKRNDSGDRKAFDFMGKPQTFTEQDNKFSFTIKGYKVDNFEGIFTQSFSADAQKTITLIDKLQKNGVIGGVSKTVVAKNLPGIAAYNHTENILYVNEKLVNAAYLKEKLIPGYFVAENAEDIIKHEMFHKKHWDFILSKGGDPAIIKHSIETELHKYVAEQVNSDYAYITKIISKNADYNFDEDNPNPLNELIAEVLLQEQKGACKDKTLLELVRRCVE